MGINTRSDYCKDKYYVQQKYKWTGVFWNGRQIDQIEELNQKIRIEQNTQT